MHIAIQTFFVIQVALERAATKIFDLGQTLVCDLVKAPIQRSFRDFIGTVEKADVQHLRDEIDSIRSEVQALRQDIRELQRTTSV